MKQFILIFSFTFAIGISYSQEISSAKNATVIPAKETEVSNEQGNTVVNSTSAKIQSQNIEQKKTEEFVPINSTPVVISSTRKQ